MDVEGGARAGGPPFAQAERVCLLGCSIKHQIGSENGVSQFFRARTKISWRQSAASINVRPIRDSYADEAFVIVLRDCCGGNRLKRLPTFQTGTALCRARRGGAGVPVAGRSASQRISGKEFGPSNEQVAARTVGFFHAHAGGILFSSQPRRGARAMERGHG